MVKCHRHFNKNSMKTFYSFIKVSFVIIFATLLVSCNHKPDYRLFMIQVDSIQVPNTLTANSPFDINFFGTIAGDGCHSFSNFNVQLDNNNLLIEAWGKVDAKAIVCPTVMVYLTGHKVTYTIQTSGIYNIKIKQPDNPYLEKQITIN